MADPLHVFIDTNVWLSFYSFTNDDLEQLRKLIALVRAGQLKLYIDDHLKDEFYRNRERKLEESIRDFSKGTIVKGVPRYMRDYPEAEKYAESVEAAAKLRDAMITRTKDEAKVKSLAADKLFADILEVSEATKVDSNIMTAALDRRLKSNPPGKYPSLGDQIHWEILLRDVPNGTDLHVVSKDGDFESTLNKGTAHPFLIDEWRERKGGQLSLHNELRPFLNSKFPDIRLAVDVEKNAAMSKLIDAGSFQATHAAIEALALFQNDFSWDDADKLLKAGLSNRQIRWIGSDQDVREFYQLLIQNFKDKLDAETLEDASKVFKQEDPLDWGVLDDPDEDVPF